MEIENPTEIEIMEMLVEAKKKGLGGIEVISKDKLMEPFLAVKISTYCGVKLYCSGGGFTIIEHIRSIRLPRPKPVKPMVNCVFRCRNGADVVVERKYEEEYSCVHIRDRVAITYDAIGKCVDIGIPANCRGHYDLIKQLSFPPMEEE